MAQPTESRAARESEHQDRAWFCRTMQQYRSDHIVPCEAGEIVRAVPPSMSRLLHAEFHLLGGTPYFDPLEARVGCVDVLHG